MQRFPHGVFEGTSRIETYRRNKRFAPRTSPLTCLNAIQISSSRARRENRKKMKLLRAHAVAANGPGIVNKSSGNDTAARNLREEKKQVGPEQRPHVENKSSSRSNFFRAGEPEIIQRSRLYYRDSKKKEKEKIQGGEKNTGKMRE